MLQHYPDPGSDCRYTDSRRWWQALTAPELRVVVTCDALELFTFERQWWPGRSRVLISHQQFPLPGQPQDTLPPEPLWQTLRDNLAPFKGQRWHVVIVLSNQFTRWLVLPWQAEIRSEAEKQAYYSHGLQQAFGLEMQGWQLRSQAGGYGQNTLVNAVLPGLTEKLEAVFAEFNLTPGVIAPAWMLSANQALHTIRQQKLAEDGWFISRESNSLTIGCLMQGEWQQISYLPVDAHWCESLSQFLLREQIIHSERAALPVFLSQAQLSGVTAKSLAPFSLIDVAPVHWLGEAFHQQLRRRLA
ncbi:hypothetical protein [Methylophilus sp. Leaf414]|uniref:hypothetical protein n=1 Tax=Methylophilus sp. Leaf414 TaxID=1736371 RepID=UPI0006F5F5AF|nr:hypothetical protein [Methylophilus sp. Leaf414]KQT36281.1 hypothetical protein ASG24_08480 [Methylophilus sp. Leaf414]